MLTLALMLVLKLILMLMFELMLMMALVLVFMVILMLVLIRVAEVGNLLASAKMAIQFFVRRVFAIFATNVLFLRVITYLIQYTMQYITCHSAPESEKPRQRVSNADRKDFANPESFATSSLLAEEFPDILENARILYKISR